MDVVEFDGVHVCWVGWENVHRRGDGWLCWVGCLVGVCVWGRGAWGKIRVKV